MYKDEALFIIDELFQYYENKLTEWERNFLISIEGSRYDSLTEKQSFKLESIEKEVKKRS